MLLFPVFKKLPTPYCTSEYPWAELPRIAHDTFLKQFSQYPSTVAHDMLNIQFSPERFIGQNVPGAKQDINHNNEPPSAVSANV